MPFVRPTLSNLVNRACAAINNFVADANAYVKQSVFNVCAKIIAGMILDVYSYITELSKNFFVTTADINGLLKRGGDMGVNRKQASFATGTVVFTGTAGTIIPKDSILKTNSDEEYKTTAPVTIGDSTTAYVPVIATSSGVNGNQPAGTEMKLVNPIVGVTSAATVDTNGITGGANIESTEEYRARLLKFMQEQPGAGDPYFYENLALSQPGVTRAKCIRTIHGAGTVGLLFMMDKTYLDGLPQSGDILKMHEFIAARMPADVNELFVAAPTLIPVDVIVSDLNPNTPEMQNSIRANLDKYLKSIPFGGTMYVSQITEAITQIPGEISHNLDYPTENFTVDETKLFTLGNVTFRVTK